MVYNTQNYWVFGLCTSSGILDTRKHNVSETGSVSVLRCLHLLEDGNRSALRAREQLLHP
jgi:hypothetical protein